jgi:hypothetical protein
MHLVGDGADGDVGQDVITFLNLEAGEPIGIGCVDECWWKRVTVIWSSMPHSRLFKSSTLESLPAVRHWELEWADSAQVRVE